MRIKRRRRRSRKRLKKNQIQLSYWYCLSNSAPFFSRHRHQSRTQHITHAQNLPPHSTVNSHLADFLFDSWTAHAQLGDVINSKFESKSTFEYRSLVSNRNFIRIYSFRSPTTEQTPLPKIRIRKEREKKRDGRILAREGSHTMTSSSTCIKTTALVPLSVKTRSYSRFQGVRERTLCSSRSSTPFRLFECIIIPFGKRSSTDVQKRMLTIPDPIINTRRIENECKKKTKQTWPN